MSTADEPDLVGADATDVENPPPLAVVPRPQPRTPAVRRPRTPAPVPRMEHDVANVADGGSSPPGGTTRAAGDGARRTCTAPAGPAWASKTHATGFDSLAVCDDTFATSTHATVPRMGHDATNVAGEGSSPSGGTTRTTRSVLGRGRAAHIRARRARLPPLRLSGRPSVPPRPATGRTWMVTGLIGSNPIAPTSSGYDSRV